MLQQQGRDVLLCNLLQFHSPSMLNIQKNFVCAFSHFLRIFCFERNQWTNKLNMEEKQQHANIILFLRSFTEFSSQCPWGKTTNTNIRTYTTAIITINTNDKNIKNSKNIKKYKTNKNIKITTNTKNTQNDSNNINTTMNKNTKRT